MGPPPAVAAVRGAVGACLSDLTADGLVLVACSGGADSLALAAALAFVATRLKLRAGAVTVDHGLQPGSAERAASVAGLLRDLGLDPVERIALSVDTASRAGPEAAARTARYRALAETATSTGAVAVLLGHTLDDQAETVLLGLARGSGARSLAGMPARRGCYRRPLLRLRRAQTRAACAALGLEPWQDPHNADPRYARARVRGEVLPMLEAALGPGVAEALARTAGMLRADDEYLDAVAGLAAQRIGGDAAGSPLAVAPLAALAPAIRTRVLRRAAVAAGCPGGALTERHIRSVEELVTRWHGQRWVDLPGGIRARRTGDALLLGPFATGSGGGAGTQGVTVAAAGGAEDTEVGRGRR